jgi:mannose-1-phosphate guanylyltransferase
MQPSHYVAIMAGGIGSRFWPSSRKDHPKQFLDILGTGKSLLQLTVERFEQIVPRQQILIVTNEAYRDLVLRQLPDFAPHQVLCEPSRNNTAPCIAYTAFYIHKLNPNATFVVAPSDHIVLRPDVFAQKIRQALDIAATQSVLLTLGLQPTQPNTGYGYIHFDEAQALAQAYKVNRFTEKPDLATATQFVGSGEYLWNAGIFVWSVRTILDALARHAPDIYQLFDKGRDLYGTALEQGFIRQNYPLSPDISIDYAIMEKADNIYTIPADIGWSDLGTWASLYEQLPQDPNGNAITNQDASLVLLENTHNCMIHTDAKKVVVLRDLNNYIVVDTPDALLIYPKNEEQAIKKVVGKVADDYQ